VGLNPLIREQDAQLRVGLAALAKRAQADDAVKLGGEGQDEDHRETDVQPFGERADGPDDETDQPSRGENEKNDDEPGIDAAVRPLEFVDFACRGHGKSPFHVPVSSEGLNRSQASKERSRRPLKPTF